MASVYKYMMYSLPRTVGSNQLRFCYVKTEIRNDMMNILGI